MRKDMGKTVCCNQKGQTILETALMIILLLMMVFGIAEISRAWWLKNQLNNAARVGVRVAIVSSSTDISNANGTCPSNKPILKEICNSITGGGLTNVSAALNGSAAIGSSVTVTVQGTFTSVVPHLLSGIPGAFGAPTLLPGLDAQGRMQMTSSSTMRHE